MDTSPDTDPVATQLCCGCNARGCIRGPGIVVVVFHESVDTTTTLLPLPADRYRPSLLNAIDGNPPAIRRRLARVDPVLVPHTSTRSPCASIAAIASASGARASIAYCAGLPPSGPARSVSISDPSVPFHARTLPSALAV